MKVKTGTVQLAKLSRAHLFGVAWSTNARHVFESWDQFIWPLPFGRGSLVWGNPVPPPSENADDVEVERVRAAFEAEMIRISREADQLAGVNRRAQ